MEARQCAIASREDKLITSEMIQELRGGEEEPEEGEEPVPFDLVTKEFKETWRLYSIELSSSAHVRGAPIWWDMYGKRFLDPNLNGPDGKKTAFEKLFSAADEALVLCSIDCRRHQAVDPAKKKATRGAPKKDQQAAVSMEDFAEKFELVKRIRAHVHRSWYDKFDEWAAIKCGYAPTAQDEENDGTDDVAIVSPQEPALVDTEFLESAEAEIVAV